MSCPINGPDRFGPNRRGTDALCPEMHCRGCIAEPQDFYEPGESDRPKDYGAYSREMPF